MENQPEVFIIIVNWNQPEHTIECLYSLEKINYPRFEIVVADNGSTDGSEEKIREKFPDVHLIQTGANLGFTGGNNAGIKYAMDKGADYVFLLNNDTVVDPDVLTPLVETGESGPSTGMLGSKIYNYYRKNEIDFTETVIDWKNGTATFPGRGEIERGEYEEAKEVESLCGCAMMVKREVIEKIGMLDDDFFAYCEDTDWSVRAKKAGYKCVFVPRSIVWHKGSATNKANDYSPMAVYYSSRNRLLFLKKNKGSGVGFHMVNLGAFLIALSSYTYSSIIPSRESKKRTAYWALRGMLDFYRGKFGRPDIDWDRA
ncbi:MAG: glycosyltransferase family 2 protein [Chloroflexi bacterium]|nr:glycosyltransferase family 2 protein [Chloroflexota bacterium]